MSRAMGAFISRSKKLFKKQMYSRGRKSDYLYPVSPFHRWKERGADDRLHVITAFFFFFLNILYKSELIVPKFFSGQDLL